MRRLSLSSRTLQNTIVHVLIHTEVTMYPTRFVEVVVARANRRAGRRWPHANWRRVARLGLKFVSSHVRATSDADKGYI